MNKRLNGLATLALYAVVALALVACGEASTSGPVFEKLWNAEVVEHKGFKDLGNYVIELPDFTDSSIEQKGLGLLNMSADNIKLFGAGCTAMAKRNDKGEVIMGRNMDLDISQCAAFVFKTTYGKYKNFCVTYIPKAYDTYEHMQQMDELDEYLMCMIPYSATDCLNEKGLYIEANLRERNNDKHIGFGLHSTHGETTRDDGTPWSELRATPLALVQLVSQNCATVKEALAFIKNSYDWYTGAPLSAGGYFNINMAYMIGDATGEYGLIEIAQDEVFYIPYQFGQANFYINPKWAALETIGAGYGRLQKVAQMIEGPQTLDEAMDAMKPIMWRNETLWLGQSKRMNDDQHQHRYNQIAFLDDKGNAQLDWRSEYVGYATVLDDGRMIVEPEVYEYAKLSTYDPKIKEYYDDALLKGTLIIDDGTHKFTVNGEQLTLKQLKAKYNEFLAGEDLDVWTKLYPYDMEYRRLLANQNNQWSHDDDNFEAIKAMAYARVHMRFNENGEFDLNGMSQYEKLCAFYGLGVEKDEKPLRDDGSVWTTSLNVGVNCAEKEMKIRFWENDEVVYHAKF